MRLIRQLTQKGDPMVRIKLPNALIEMLEVQAKKNRRRTQDQFIKSLTETFKYEAAFSKSFAQYLFDLENSYK